MANGIYVDQNEIMRVMVGSMLQIVNQNHMVTQLQEETKNLCLTVKDLEDNLLETKVKVYNLEYDVQKLNGFSASYSIVIRNLEIPINGNDKEAVEKALEKIGIEEFEPKEDLLKVERKGNTAGKLGSVLVKFANDDLKKKVMKKKNDMIQNSAEPGINKLKIMNYKAPEHIIFENALRNVLSLLPNANQYELNGNMKLVSRT